MSEPLDVDACRENLDRYASVRDYRSCRDIGLAALREVERLRAAVDRVKGLCVNPGGGAPPNGTYVVAHYAGGHQDIDEEKVWCRADGAVDREPHPDGDWWIVGAEHKGRHQWGEVLWLDDPPCDRGRVDLEWLIPVEDIDLALRGQVTA